MSGGRGVLYDLGEHVAESFLGDGLRKLFAGHLEALGLTAVAISFIIPLAAYFIVQAIWLPPEPDPRDVWDRQIDQLDPDDDGLMCSLFSKPRIVADLARKTNQTTAQSVSEFTEQIRQLREQAKRQ